MGHVVWSKRGSRNKTKHASSNFPNAKERLAVGQTVCHIQVPFRKNDPMLPEADFCVMNYIMADLV